ncbi:hypothetical protein M2367_000696 [Aeromonas sp. BIGb0445]|nr:hypothetical protein [Aeromonas sp. BIGb0445]
MQSERRTSKAKDAKHEAMRQLKAAYLKAKEQGNVTTYKVSNA